METYTEPELELYLNCSDDFSITDDKGKAYTPEEARRIVESGVRYDCNLAFNRLIHNNYDVEAVREFYKNNP